VGSGFGRRFYGMDGVLKQVPCAPHVRLGEWFFVPPFSAIKAATSRTYELEVPAPDRGSRHRDPVSAASILMRY
jgi:hypothetical protein